MHTYVKLKDGRIMIIWSDNTEEEIMRVYPLNEQFTSDIEVDCLTKINYSDIVIIDSNLFVIEYF